jgi:hypothetical protein
MISKGHILCNIGKPKFLIIPFNILNHYFATITCKYLVPIVLDCQSMNQNRKTYFITLCKSTKILNPMPSKPFSFKVPKEKTKNHGVIHNITLDYQANYIKYLYVLILK